MLSVSLCFPEPTLCSAPEVLRWMGWSSCDGRRHALSSQTKPWSRLRDSALFPSLCVWSWDGSEKRVLDPGHWVFIGSNHIKTIPGLNWTALSWFPMIHNGAKCSSFLPCQWVGISVCLYILHFLSNCLSSQNSFTYHLSCRVKSGLYLVSTKDNQIIKYFKCWYL